MKIKNVIFDYGNTIVEFIPGNIVRRFGVSDPEKAKLIEEKVFDIKLWGKADSLTALI